MDYQYPLDLDWTTEEMVIVTNMQMAVEQANKTGLPVDKPLTTYQQFETVVKSIGEEKCLGREFENVLGYSLCRTFQRAKRQGSGKLKLGDDQITEMQKFVQTIRSQPFGAIDVIRINLELELTVQQKNGRIDLATNMDGQTQGFLMNKIQANSPEDQTLGEEKGYNTLKDFADRAWTIDPVDGMMNFVMERENFCIMLAVYEEGTGKPGFIYNVIREELYWGGKELGAYRNNQLLKAPTMKASADGLWGMNAYVYGKNIHHATEIGQASMGVCISGYAGLETIAMLKGNHHDYLSDLSSWDYATGLALLKEFRFKHSGIIGKPLTFVDREYFIATTPETYDEVFTRYLSESK